MKKFTLYTILFLGLFLSLGCDNLMNTPTKKVEQFLNKYQTLDSDVMVQFDEILDKDFDYSDEEEDLYRKTMARQYKNLTYEIKDSKEDGNKAYVTVQIEVYDYGKALREAEEYLLKNQSEFINNDGSVNISKYTTYKLERMKEEKTRITYTLELSVSKEAETWMLDDITEIDRQKIHGIYSN